jgi:putative sigma-54 modulation protein
MQTSVTFKNLKASDDLKDYIGSKLDRFDRYLDNPAEANVVFSIEKFRHIVEVSIIGDRLNINGREEQEDMYSAIDIVLDKLEKQIKKSKGKQKKRRNKNQDKMDMSVLPSEIPDFDTEPQVEMIDIEFKPMSVDEAVEQMKIIDNAFLVFTNAKTERVNVLYRKNDGNYGLIQPMSS